MRRPHVLLVLAAAVVLAGCGAGGHGTGRSGAAPGSSATATAGPAAAGPAAVVATVDGAPVDLGEFRLTLAADESAAYQHFGQPKGAAAGFWTTPAGGVRPIDWLKKRALADAVRNKSAERLGQQRHVADVLDYPALVDHLDAENQRRSAAISNDQPVYGPQRFDLAEYYDLWLSELKMQLIGTLPKADQQQNDRKYASMLDDAVQRRRCTSTSRSTRRSRRRTSSGEPTPPGRHRWHGPGRGRAPAPAARTVPPAAGRPGRRTGRRGGGGGGHRPRLARGGGGGAARRRRAAPPGR